MRLGKKYSKDDIEIVVNRAELILMNETIRYKISRTEPIDAEKMLERDLKDILKEINIKNKK